MDVENPTKTVFFFMYFVHRQFNGKRWIELRLNHLRLGRVTRVTYLGWLFVLHENDDWGDGNGTWIN